jgi:hypothetical protein
MITDAEIFALDLKLKEAAARGLAHPAIKAIIVEDIIARLREAIRERDQQETDEPHCPRCGSEKFEYIGDVQRCADCGK